MGYNIYKMRQAFEQQLARADELPRVPGLVAYIRENEGTDQVSRLYERFMWEMRREKEPRKALQTAKIALSYSPSESPDTRQAIEEISRAIHRAPLLLRPRESIELGEGLQVVNLWEQEIWIAESDLLFCKSHFSPDHSLIVVCDDQRPGARIAKEQTIWNVPVIPGSDYNDEDAVARLWEQHHKGQLPERIGGWADHRRLVSPDGLDGEHQIRAAKTRDMVQAILLSHSYGPSPEELSSIEPDEMEWAMGQIDLFFEHYTGEPRLALACRSLKDFSPLADWQQHGPQGQTALLEAVTGNNPLISEALHSVDRMRMGSLAFTGDPDHNGDDLLSAVLPSQDCTVVLRPETLERTVFFTGMPHPGAELPVPDIDNGLYNTVAVGRGVTDLLRTRTYICLTPATEDSIRDYFQGKTDELELEDATANPAFQALITAIMVRRKQGEDNPMVKSALRVAAAHAIYVGLNSDPSRDPMGGVHLGGLTLDDVEQIVVSVRNEDEWETYHRSGILPNWLLPAKKFFDSKDIRLRARSPIGHGSMAVAE